MNELMTKAIVEQPQKKSRQWLNNHAIRVFFGSSFFFLFLEIENVCKIHMDTQCKISNALQCAVCSVQCTVCSVQCAVCSVQCAVCSVQCAVYPIC